MGAAEKDYSVKFMVSGRFKSWRGRKAQKKRILEQEPYRENLRYLSTVSEQGKIDAKKIMQLESERRKKTGNRRKAVYDVLIEATDLPEAINDLTDAISLKFRLPENLAHELGRGRNYVAGAIIGAIAYPSRGLATVSTALLGSIVFAGGTGFFKLFSKEERIIVESQMKFIRNWIKSTEFNPIKNIRDKYDYFFIDRNGSIIFTNFPPKQFVSAKPKKLQEE